jgi:hypothetical protein
MAKNDPIADALSMPYIQTVVVVAFCISSSEDDDFLTENVKKAILTARRVCRSWKAIADSELVWGRFREVSQPYLFVVLILGFRLIVRFVCNVNLYISPLLLLHIGLLLRFV